MSIQAAYNAFQIELTALFLLEQKTQSQIGSSMSPPQAALVNEAILTRGFRAYENLLESAFMGYAQSQPTLSNVPVASYLRPLNVDHTYHLIRSSQAFLEWNSPSVVIERAECYLDQGGPVKVAIASKQSTLNDIRRIRNHIAHNSRASMAEYQKVVRQYLGTLPLALPTPGEFLNKKKKATTKSLLRHFVEELADIGELLVR